ncbi:hypothetical protein ACI7BZ_01075 [Xanthobacter sp. AM11]|uniref:hypothetical protein n=1 Tax=Xanthobacter sp. AM11 TaxID=3380643 RepID=UPI0039BFC917
MTDIYDLTAEIVQEIKSAQNYNYNFCPDQNAADQLSRALRMVENGKIDFDLIDLILCEYAAAMVEVDCSDYAGALLRLRAQFTLHPDSPRSSSVKKIRETLNIAKD